MNDSLTDEAQIEALLAQVPDTEEAVLIGPEHQDFTNALITYAHLRGLEDRLSEAKSKMTKRVEAMEAALVPLFEARRVKSVKLEGIGTVGTAVNNNPKVLTQDGLFAWLKSVGEDGLIKGTVHYMSLKALLNARITEGKSLPPSDVCELTSGQSLRLTRAKK